MKLKNYGFKMLRGLVIQLMLFTTVCVALISLTPVSVHAQFQPAEDTCQVKRQITMTDILAPAVFFPVIPRSCATTADGAAVPLTPAVLPDIAIRFFGALISLIFYLFFFVAIFSGVQWIYGGIDEKQALQAKRNFQDSFLGLVIVLSVYMIVNTLIVYVLKVKFDYADMNDFFSI